ncbi:FecR family protein [Sunxiuqinia sp. A32]|uniref:FecR family protein n=1 Tax=Sunxiuqinia sp. A32 TaxID=3461496 RepID=UPI0040461258
MLEKYFQDKELNEGTKRVLRDQWEKFESNPSEHTNLDHVFYRLYYGINSGKDQHSRRKTLYWKISQIAAILIIGVLFAASLYFYKSGSVANSTQKVEFISHGGFRNQFKLPDGTTGWLGYSSTLKYHIDSNNQRVVDLDGLAYFDVAHQQKSPFIVKTPTELDIEVLGTKFNVSSYSEEKSCEIILEQGSVSLNLKDQEVGKMIPNDRVTYQVGYSSVEKSRVEVDDYVAWTYGKLVLNDVSLEEACKKLSRFYNVEFDLQTENSNKQKIRLLLEDETLEDALNLLTMISSVTYQIEDRKMLDNKSYSKKRIIIKNE